MPKPAPTPSSSIPEAILAMTSLGPFSLLMGPIIPD